MPNDDPLQPSGLLHPLLPQPLIDALAAVRSRGAYYGGAPVAPGPAVRPGFAVEPAKFPVITGPRMEEAPGMGLKGANQNYVIKPLIDERARILAQLVAKRDFVPRIVGGRMYFDSLTPRENQTINTIGWSRAPNVTHEDEMSADPLTMRRAWERNIRHWHELASPKE